MLPGHGLVKKQANVISKEKENMLWEKGMFGNDYVPSPLHALFWTIVINSDLCCGDEHRNLTIDNV